VADIRFHARAAGFATNRPANRPANKPANKLGEQQPDQPAIAGVRLAAQQAGRLHPSGGPGHGGGGQPKPPGDPTGRLSVLDPQLTQDELLAFVHAVPREGRRGRHRQGVLGRPERRLEVGRRLIIGVRWLVNAQFLRARIPGHGSFRVRPWSTLAGSW